LLFLPGQRFQSHNIVTSPGSVGSIGLAGIGKLDESSESTRIRMRASNIIMILLHRNPLENISSSGRRDGGDCSLEEMAETFFNHVSQYSIQSLFGLNGEHIRENLMTICGFDHLR